MMKSTSKIFILAISLFSLPFFFLLILNQQISSNVKPMIQETQRCHHLEGRSSNAEFLVNTPGCQIRRIDPFDSEIRSMYSYEGNINCPESKVLSIATNVSHIIIDHETSNRLENEENFTCCYRTISRKENGKSDDKYMIDEKMFYITESTVINDEFIVVGCIKNKKTIFRNFFPFIQKKKEVEKQCEKKFIDWTTATNEVQQRLSITAIGLDSTSRLNMLRHMPMTYSYLKDVMKAIDFQGYTKVADNTFVNVVPMLTGLFAEECWNETMQNSSLNYMNFIWKNFSANGYRTLFADDFPEIAMFNYLKAGFFDQPTDYYLRPFTLAASDYMNLDNNCYGDKPEIGIILQWVLDFHETFRNKPTFAYIFNSRITHDDLNSAGKADSSHYNFLKTFWESNYNNNSVLIFFSDHGMRFGKIRSTFVGKIEERMPPLFIVLPAWFQFQYPEIYNNLQINQNRLTTPFDVYETLKELLHFTGKVKTANVNERGISLFSEIPPERTCKDAAILPHWCVCNQRTKVNIKDVHVMNSANKLVEVINNYLSREKRCAVLKLDKIVDAFAVGLNDKVLAFKYSQNDVINRMVAYGKKANAAINYLITVLVKPSNALFEATVEYLEASTVYIVSGDISRINKYGNQAACIKNFKLQKFCYCKH